MRFSDELEKEFAAKQQDFQSALKEKKLTIPDDPDLGQMLKKAFVFSDYIASSCIFWPDLPIDLVETGDLYRAYPADGFHQKLKKHLETVTEERSLKNCLTRFRKREMVRVAWRDLCGLSGYAETVAELSAFADACVAESLTLLHQWESTQYGEPLGSNGLPQHLVVLGMGKLGTRELNFSSDIDLIFAFPEPGHTLGGQRSPVTNEEFFTRLGRRLINVLGAVSPEGNLFRVDMRLRPYGENGPLVMSFDNLEDYYQLQGREWERYAWLRARCMAGDMSAGRDLMDRIRPFVYRRYLDYTVLDALREMKNRIAAEVARKEMAGNVKLGPGGIREIEFFCQMFQILRGGVTPSLQEGDTLYLLHQLAVENLITDDTASALTEVYVFLRRTEHRLQEFADAQVHTIPDDGIHQERLSRAMGFEDTPGFLNEIAQRMGIAHHHFSLLLAPEQPAPPEDPTANRLLAIWQTLDPTPAARDILEKCGYTDTDAVFSAMRYLKDASETKALSPKGRERVNRLIPLLLSQVGGHEDADKVFSRIMDLVRVIERRTSYIALLLENPMVLPHLIRLAGESAWIVKFLARHPVLLDELLDPRTLYAPPEKAALQTEIAEQLERIPAGDVEFQIESLCIFKQVNVLRVAAADVTEALHIMRVSDHLTEIAETLLEAVTRMAWDFLVARHGLPEGCPGADLEDSGFLVVGYGKLGGIEMGYQSDVDLVFLHTYPKGTTRGAKPIDNGYFYTRLGQRIVHLLTTHTRAGVIYETDMRLRPSGSTGPLVSEINSFKNYQLNDGWTWEQQALVRARPICGDPEAARWFTAIREQVLSLPKDLKQLTDDVIAMRHRMQQGRPVAVDQFDYKNGNGGIIDIEFLVQYLVLANADRYKKLLTWTDNIRLLETLAEHDILTPSEAEALKTAYLTFRSAIHKCNLKEIPPKSSKDQFFDIRENVIKNWKKYLSEKTKS